MTNDLVDGSTDAFWKSSVIEGAGTGKNKQRVRF
jgi:hypothetical protein